MQIMQRYMGTLSETHDERLSVDLSYDLAQSGKNWLAYIQYLENQISDIPIEPRTITRNGCPLWKAVCHETLLGFKLAL